MPNMRPPLQDGIDYKAAVISQICSSTSVLGLLVNDPQLDIDSDEAYRAADECIFDYNYIDRTVERSDAFIMVETEMVQPISGTMNDWKLYVQAVCHKGYVPLDPKKFKGVKGNRNDNLVYQIDRLLNGVSLFGIGFLELESCSPAVVPDSFTSKMLTYRIKEFRRERHESR